MSKSFHFTIYYVSIDNEVSVSVRYFPSQGERVYVFMTDSALPAELSNIGTMVHKLREQTDIITSVDSWHTNFKQYYEENFMQIDGKQEENILIYMKKKHWFPLFRRALFRHERVDLFISDDPIPL